MDLTRRLPQGSPPGAVGAQPAPLGAAARAALVPLLLFVCRAALADDASSAASPAIDWRLLMSLTWGYARAYVPVTAALALVCALFVEPRLIRHWTRDYKPFLLKARGFGEPVSFAADRAASAWTEGAARRTSSRRVSRRAKATTRPATAASCSSSTAGRARCWAGSRCRSM